MGATTVAPLTMQRQEREQLEHEVQQLERARPGASAADLESEVRSRAPVAYESWKAETPNLRSRLRAVQRWRRGARGRDAGKGAVHLFPYLWPIGERQRREVDPGFTPSPMVASGSWRIFLYNCGPEVVRDVRVFLDKTALDYSPSILTGHFTEIHWQRQESIKAATMLSDGPDPSRHELRVEFVIARGTRQSELVGALTLHPQQGWMFFAGKDGRAREVE
ncbi:MAG: hypothetical protein L3K17_02755 [Thermoplasmata archaeon]|nr:hypothetical protein [Thermoplasmata archaeon]